MKTLILLSVFFLFFVVYYRIEIYLWAKNKINEIEKTIKEIEEE